MTTVKITKMHGDDADLVADSWRLVRAGEVAPKKGDHGSWVETDHPAVVACMGSTPECAENGCQLNWRPIESAPTDGTNVLLWWPFWCKGRPTIGYFGYRGIQQWVAPEALEGDGDPPTHWMPLPDPPSGGADGGRESPA